MIRDYISEDKDELQKLINNIDTGYEIDDLNDIQANAVKFIVFDEEDIKGFSYVTLSTNGDGEQEAQISLYVERQSRLNGIGTALYQEMEDYLNGKKPDYISAYTRVDIENPQLFCEKVGFHKWWGSPELFFYGDKFPDVDLDFVKYEEKFFDQYVKVVQDAYYEINRSNDIKPYLPSEKSVLKYQLSNKEKVYLALDDDQIVASVTVGEGTVDNLMVSAAYRGNKYGKQALQFGINKMIDQGYEEIRICYMENNTTAEKLYFSLGFKPLQNLHVYRKFIKK